MSLARTMLLVSLCLPLCLSTALADGDKDKTKDHSVAGLYKSGALFDAKQYRIVRAAFSKAFQQKHAAAIRKAYAADHAELVAWLAKRPDVEEELYAAIDEKDDDVLAALTLFAQLWKDFPKEVEEYPGLAIATAIVWDRPTAVYDYRHHQVRTKSKMPDGLVDGRGNFEYLVNANQTVTSSLKVLPREFLAFVVDHRTPLEERKWAQQFVRAQKGASSWHQSVPYDKGMLETERSGKGPGPKLAGYDYTLANVKKHGGVCAQQADFVARVGKSLGQPTVYVSGESSYRGWHAWVMWVNVVKPGKEKEKEGVRFDLVSDGRTRGFERDAFYVGHLKDPQTGKAMLDRDLDRRLSVVGMGARLRRQTYLAMKAYEQLADEQKFDVKERLAFLERVWQLSPYSEEAWRALARLAKAGELSGAHQAVASAKQAVLLKTFSRWPDFIAAISADLLAAEATPAARIKHLTPQVVLYEKVLRPDLTCDAQMRVAADLREQKKHKEAAAALTRAVRKFPTEGRYVPRLLTAYEEVCEDYPQGVTALAGLYLELAPALVKHYKGETNPFLTKVIRQGHAFFGRHKLPKQKAQVEALTAGVKLSEK